MSSVPRARHPSAIDPATRHASAADDGAHAASARRSANLVLATASAICALIILDTNVVAVSLPSIARTFHASFAEVEWVVSAYMVTFASCLLAAGGLADRIGRKRMLLIGLGVFALASLGCGLAPTVLWLNIARAVKGLGAAMEITSALAIIGHTFREEKERARAWALWGMAMGIATTVAPLVGGAITQFVGWRWIFLMNLPICATLAWCASRVIGESKNHDAASIDKVGSVLFGLALACGIWTLIEAGSQGWTSASTLARAAASVLLLATFVAVERRIGHAMVDLSLFKGRRFVGAVLAMYGYAACAQVMMTFLPLYLQNAFGLPAVAAGFGMLPFALAMVVGPFIGAAVLRHYSMEWALVVGLVLIGAGNVFTGIVAQAGSYAWVSLGMLVSGCGAGIMNGNTQKAIVALVAPARVGMASGISTTTRFTAIVMSVGVLGGVLAARTKDAFVTHVPAHSPLAGVVDGTFVSRVLAGDAAQAVSTAPQNLHAVLTALARSSFASGFSEAMYVAGAVALLLSVTVWGLAIRK
ncbi:MAG TPA: MFS transporter [Pararobbsia sp.]|nr:MFS transporter [Pararobbsia sp.]